MASELEQFAFGVAQQTGLDPRFVTAWAQQETGGRANSHNWLNLRPYHENQGGPTDDVGVIGHTSGNFDEFATVQDAITSSVHRINQPFARPILDAKGKSPVQEIAALASTGWDAGHYGGVGGPNLQRTFAGLYGKDALGSPAVTAATGGVGPNGESQRPGAVGSVVNDPVGAVTGAAGSVEDAFKFLTSWRFAEIVGGFALVLVSFYLIGRQFGIAPPAKVAAAAAMV